MQRGAARGSVTLATPRRGVNFKRGPVARIDFCKPRWRRDGEGAGWQPPVPRHVDLQLRRYGGAGAQGGEGVAAGEMNCCLFG